MKKKDLRPENVNGCCATNDKAINTNEACCEQPSDGSLCCDKSETKEENSATTGCC